MAHHALKLHRGRWPQIGHVVHLWCGYFDVVRVSPFDPMARADGSTWRRFSDQRQPVNIAPNPRYALPTCKGCLAALQQEPGGLEAWAADAAARTLQALEDACS